MKLGFKRGYDGPDDTSLTPVIRLMTNPRSLGDPLRKLRRAMRDSLNKDFEIVQRRDAAHDMLYLLPLLGFDQDVEDSIRADWLAVLPEIVTSPRLNEQLAWHGARLVGLRIEPEHWSEFEFGKLQIPRWHRLPGYSAESDTIKTPWGIAEYWSDSVDAALLALAQGTMYNWSGEDLAATQRMLVLHCVLGSPYRHDATPEDRLRFFEIKGTTLWDALSKRLPDMAIGFLPSPCGESFQDVVYRHLSGGHGRRRTLSWAEPGTVSFSEYQKHAGHQTPDPLEPGYSSASICVVPEPIPIARDPYCKGVVASYQVLQSPLPVAKLPELSELQGALDQLRVEFPWAREAIERIDDMLVPACLAGSRVLNLRSVLLAGPPGSGKSRLARRVAETFQLPFMPLACGGSHDSKLLLGSSRGWAQSEPSPVLRLLRDQRSASAFVLLDELDKAGGGGRNGPSLASILLGLLEPETASRWRDAFLLTNCNLSHVAFWATANSLRTIPRALLSRFEVVYVPEPGAEHMPGLATCMADELSDEWGMPRGFLPEVPQHVLGGKGANAREVRARVRSYMAVWCRDVLGRRGSMH